MWRCPEAAVKQRPVETPCAVIAPRSSDRAAPAGERLARVWRRDSDVPINPPFNIYW
jgi:hypothetical protein